MEVTGSSRCCRRNIAISGSCWADLPAAILFLVLDKLLEPIDHVYLGAVCREWHFVGKKYNNITKRWCKVLPMLMVPLLEDGVCKTNRMLCSLPTIGKTCRNVHLPVPYTRRCSGSSHGWLATIDQTFTISLYNPFKKEVIPICLPPLDFIPSGYNKHARYVKKQYEYYVPKVILSSDPTLNPDNYVVLALYDIVYKLAFIKAGQEKWTYVKEIDWLFDAIFYNSQIYAVRQAGEIVSFDVNGNSPPQPQRLTPDDPFSWNVHKAYLVESTKGDLLHVRRFLKPEIGLDTDFWSETFTVYKLVFNEDDGSIYEQVKLKSIGDEALFLGDNHSVSILASKFPTCQPNSIYYTNDSIYARPSGMGIFNLQVETITQNYPVNFTPRYVPRAIWIVPQFNGLC